MTEVIMRADAAERKVLEGALYAPKEAARLLALVTTEDFSDAGMRMVFRAARDLVSQREPVNQHTVKAMLRALGRLCVVDRSLFTASSPASVAEAEAAAVALVRRRGAHVAQAPSTVNVAQPPSAAKTKKRPHPRAGVPHQADDDVALRDFASVEASLAEVTWLWEGWLPRGLVTVLAASSGEGKSGLALEIARRAMGGAAT